MRSIAAIIAFLVGIFFLSCGTKKAANEGTITPTINLPNSELNRSTNVESSRQSERISSPPPLKFPSEDILVIIPEMNEPPKSQLEKVDTANSALFVEYMDDYWASHGAEETLGYHTEAIRFMIPQYPEGGSFSCADIHRLMKEGESLAERLFLSQVTGYVLATISYSIGELKEYHITTNRNTIIVERNNERKSYLFAENGDLQIVSESNRPYEIETWSSRDGGSFMLQTSDPDGPSRGRYVGGIKQPTYYVERPANEPNGSADTIVSFRYTPEGIWLRTDGVEPINECLIVGLDAWLRGGPLLERMALAELFLGPGRRLTPLFAAAVLAIHSEK